MDSTLNRVCETILSFFNAQALMAAFEIKIFDAIGDGATAPAICADCGLPESSGGQLLIALRAMGFLTRQEDRYQLAPGMPPYLLSTSPQYMGTLARHSDRFLYPLWSNSSQAIRQNTNQRKAVWGDDRSWFDILYSKPEDVEDFHAFLSILADPFVDSFVAGYDFSKHKHLLDLGSGRAALPRKVIAAHPHLSASVCDLPKAAQHMREELANAGLEDRITVYEGDVVAGNLPMMSADLVHMGWMLHDYSAATQQRILANVFKALPSGATFIASETALNDDESGPAFVALLSLNMLISCDGGIESTTRQYLDRFKEAGFVNLRSMAIPGPRTLLIGEKP